MGDVLILVLVFISAITTMGLSQYIEEKFPNYPIREPFGLLLLIFLGVFGFGFFILLTWILEWINF